jgi:hypothetical protein
MLSGAFASPALAASPLPTTIAVPQVAGPVSVSPTSYPWNAADQNVAPLSLIGSGYQETEYFVSGLASVYTWSASNTAVIQTPDAPYTSRILVRRPANAAGLAAEW